MSLRTKYTKAKNNDPDLVDFREVMWRNWKRGISPYNKALADAHFKINKKLERLVGPNRTSLTTKQLQKMSLTTRKELHLVIKEAKALTSQLIDENIQRTFRAYNKSFASNGIQKLTSLEKDTIARRVRQQMGRRFPGGSELTYMRRLDKVGAHHYLQTKKTLMGNYEKGTLHDSIKFNTQQGLKKHGIVKGKGGSLANKLRRIMVGEETRASHLIAVESMKFRDIEFAYWRLHPQHPWYGGQEICELHASSVQNISTDLKDAGYNPNTVDQEGLYKIGDWPDYPHPWCKCYPSPLYP